MSENMSFSGIFVCDDSIGKIHSAGKILISVKFISINK